MILSIFISKSVFMISRQAKVWPWQRMRILIFCLFMVIILLKIEITTIENAWFDRRIFFMIIFVSRYKLTRRFRHSFFFIIWFIFIMSNFFSFLLLIFLFFLCYFLHLLTSFKLFQFYKLKILLHFFINY